MKSGKEKKLLSKLQKQKKVRGKRQRKEAPPKTAQRTIRYRRMFEDGYCEVEEGFFSKTFSISDINYLIAQREEQLDIFSRYCELLNSCDSSTHLQINIINKKRDMEHFQEEILFDEKGDGLDDHRKEMNQMLQEKVAVGQNSLVKEKYVTLSAPAKDHEQAKQSIGRLEVELEGQFNDLGCTTKILDGQDRLELLHDIMQPNKMFNFKYQDLLYSGLTTKSAIAPSSFNFRKNRNTFEFGSNLNGKVLFLRELSADISDKLIAEITDIAASLQISIHIDPVAQDKAFDIVKSKISFMELQKVDEQKKAIKGGYDPDMISYELKYSLEEAELLLENLQNRNQKMFKVTFLIFVAHENEKELEEIVQQIMSVGRKNNTYIDTLDFMQEEGFNTILPLGKNHVDIQRTLTTASTAIFVPFTAQELMQKKGIYYGINAMTKNMIIFDRKTLKAPNGFILGTPGSGKSFAVKKEEVSVLLDDENSEVIIVDPEREQMVLAEGLGGEIVQISAGAQTFVNPMDITMNYGDDENPVILKTDFILSICDLLLGGLTAGQKTVIDRACRFAYSEYFNAQGRAMPTLKDFHRILSEQPEEDAKSLALELDIYINGTLSVFANQTNVNTNKRLVVYDTKDLGKQLKTFGMMIVLDQIWNRITRNRARGIRTWIYFEEIQLYFTNDYCANYFFELWSRARKWGAIPTGITQNVETLLLNDLARRMLSNSDFIMMFNQATSDRNELADLLNISKQQQRHITKSEEGSGLLFAGDTIVPFYDKFPINTNLYKMMSTKPEEVYQYQQEMNLVGEA
ncbi:conjugal transfer protein [Listeria booriae]|nr:conjugal transfer protein [Listeria booriae]